MLRRVGDGAVDAYVASFVARGAGVQGLIGPPARLLVTDDRAYEALATALPNLARGTITVSATARRCTELVRSAAGWSAAKPVTAMVCRDLRTVPEVAVPSGLTLRPVRDVEAAAALAMRADPRIYGPLEAFADYLRGLEGAVQLLEAVDGDGTVRATAGARVFGAEATLFFVNTDPDWQRRGIGRAMTAAALRAARDLGASRACLDASDAGGRIYLSLGFEDAGPWTQFSSCAR
jgi:GNAT superfamily N-acetyltransferase